MCVLSFIKAIITTSPFHRLGEDIYVDTNDVWDNGDHVGISILPEKIKIIKV